MARLFLIQSLLIVLTTLVLGVYGTQTVDKITVLWVMAALYGGFIALINTLLLTWRVRRTLTNINTATNKNTIPQKDVFFIYIGAVERFVFTLVAMGLGMGWLGLHPPVLLATFAVAQLAHLIIAGGQNHSQIQKPSTKKLEMGHTS